MIKDNTNSNTMKLMFQQFLHLFSPFRDGALYDPSTPTDTKLIVELLDLHKGDIAVDLGSGDGRIVFEMAKTADRVVGIENDPALIEKSTLKAQTLGLDEKVTFLYDSFWNINFHQFNKITIYQYYTVMNRLETKILKETRPGTYVVSHLWEFPRWKPVKKIKDMYLYIKQ